MRTRIPQISSRIFLEHSCPAERDETAVFEEKEASSNGNGKIRDSDRCRETMWATRCIQTRGTPEINGRHAWPKIKKTYVKTTAFLRTSVCLQREKGAAATMYDVRPSTLLSRFLEKECCFFPTPYCNFRTYPPVTRHDGKGKDERVRGKCSSPAGVLRSIEWRTRSCTKDPPWKAFPTLRTLTKIRRPLPSLKVHNSQVSQQQQHCCTCRLRMT